MVSRIRTTIERLGFRVRIPLGELERALLVECAPWELALDISPNNTKTLENKLA